VTYVVQDRVTWNNDLVKFEEEAMLACEAVWKAYEAWGNAESDYRRERAIAYLKARNDGSTQGDAEKVADMKVSHLKRQSIITEGLAKSALEAARTSRTRVSSAQSRLAAWREEADLAKTGPMT